MGTVSVNCSVYCRSHDDWTRKIFRYWWNISSDDISRSRIGGAWKCGSGKCDTVKNARVENTEVEKSGADSRGRKCKSRLAIWKAKPRLYSETALSYFLKVSSDFWVNKEWFLLHYKMVLAFVHEHRSQASSVACYTIQTWVVRTLCVNSWTAQLLKSRVLTHLDVYISQVSWALFTACLRPIHFSLHYMTILVCYNFIFWQLSMRYSSCIFHSSIFRAPLREQPTDCSMCIFSHL